MQEQIEPNEVQSYAVGLPGKGPIIRHVYRRAAMGQYKLRLEVRFA